MDRNPFQCCVPPCFRPKSSRCPCHLPLTNRVGPAKPVVFTISKSMSPNQRAVDHEKSNGQTNLYFDEDEFALSESALDDCQKPIGHNGNGTIVKDNADVEKYSESKEAPKCNLNDAQTFYAFLSTVFVQLSKSKQLRVIHIKTKEEEQDACVNRVNMRNTSSSSDDEEDYWFSKWSRRPKLKKNVNSSKSRRETLLEINARTTLRYEHERSEETSDETTFQVLRRQNERSPSPSPDNICAVESPAEAEMEVTKAIEDDPDPPVAEGFIENRASPSLSAFTNLAFQFDPDDHGDPEDEKTEPSYLNNSDQEGATDPVTTGQVKVNGTVPGMESSPSKTNGHVTPLRESSSEPSVQVQLDYSKPLLFFVHGISSSSDVWKSQFQFFHNHGYEIVAPDLLGHGMSSTPEKAKYYLFESLVQDLVAVFDHFVSDTRKSVVIGHGYGACMGTVLSRIRSQNVTVLISASGGGPTPLIPFGCLERPLLPIRFRFRKKKSIGRFDNPELAHVLPSTIHQHVLNGQLWVEGDTAFHRRITVPTLLVYGLRDTVVSLVEECEMERTIPKAFLELIPTAGHMMMCEEPDNFNRMLITFIESWTDAQT